MTKFLKTIILTILCINSISTMGQDTTKTKKIKEYYFTLADISPLNVSIKYKRQLKNRTFLKIGLVNLSAHSSTSFSNASNSYPTRLFGYSAGLESGLEFRKAITDKFTFFHGLNLSFTYETSTNIMDNPTLPTNERRTVIQAYKGGISYTLGLLFKLNNHFLFSAEINPALSFTNSTRDYGQNPSMNYTSISSDFLFANKNGLLSIVYRL